MPLKNLRSTVSGHVPASLAEGQFGFNEADGILFVNNAAGQVVGYNLAQLVAGLSAARSIATGGTGATTAAQALAALGGQAAATAAQLDDVRQLMIQMAMLRGKVANYASGFADDYQDQSGVDAASSSGQIYDTTNRWYTNTAAEASQSLPAMTSNTAPSGYTASASSQSGTGYAPWMAADQNTSTYWQPTTTSTLPSWWQRQGPAITLAGYYLNPQSGTTPTAWTVLGSNDGAAWTTLDTQTGQSPGAGANTFYTTPPANRGSYTYHRINFTGGTIALSEIGLLQQITSSLDLRSVAAPASIVPSKAGLFVLVKPLNGGIITPNTNLVASVTRTRSAGTPIWTPATLVAAGAIGGFNVYEANAVDISGQPSGQSMGTRLQTSGGLAVAAQANVMQWAA